MKMIFKTQSFNEATPFLSALRLMIYWTVPRNQHPFFDKRGTQDVYATR